MNGTGASTAALRAQAEAAANALPPLTLSAGPAALNFGHGAHGLRRPGSGEDFWQYRLAHQGDTAAAIDWRRSARGDLQFVRDRERQVARRATFWIGRGAGMGYAGQGTAPGGARESKLDRARLIALALSLSMIRAGERVGMLGAQAGTGAVQASRMTETLARLLPLPSEIDSPDPTSLRRGQAIILMDDFLYQDKALDAFLHAVSGIGSGGIMLQILHPDEEDFPFEGAIRFETQGGLTHQTRDANGLRDAYRTRLSLRRTALAEMAAQAGFIFGTHHLGQPVSQALIWAHGALTAR
ncbi:DUF58 domain-containing protein [Paracoccus jeotgali]|uniref:DUF58 domain-containing protein n=1 Tax=Paracoccus jeotgali TaxID=2065379 RepID=UPI001CEF8869|nr:DUF58 domain-containing protein [Paracoccus jeotgali]